MSIALLIPWRGGCQHRDAALSWVWSRYDVTQPTWERVVGHHYEGDWCKALAVADALSRTDADILVVADADVLLEPGALRRAVAVVEQGAPWAVPHVKVRRLTEQATAHLYATGIDTGEYEKPSPYTGVLGGGCVVIRRDVYEDCPLDPRFAGWGGEDLSWGEALTVLHGEPERLDSDLLHLWHPHPARIDRHVGTLENQDVRLRYKRAFDRASMSDRVLAAQGRDAMRGVVDEGKSAPHLHAAADVP